MTAGPLASFLIVVLLFGLLATGFSVAFSLLSVSILGYMVLLGPQAVSNIYTITLRTIMSDVYIAVALFTFMGSLFQNSGIGERMYSSMHKWMGGVRGGLALGTIVVSTIIAAISGVATTATVIMGMLAYPEMMKRGYSKHIAIGCIQAGALLDPLIPPGVGMIVLAGLTGLSVGKLFIAGIIPGMLWSLLFMLYILVACFYNPKLGPPLPLAERAGWNDKLSSLLGLVAPTLLVFVILGGIYLGICTATEAAGLGAIGGLICAAVYGNLNRRNLWEAVTVSFRITAMILWICVGGACFATLTIISGIAGVVGDAITALPLSPLGIIAAMMIILLILGMFMESMAIIIVCIPIMMQVAVKLNFDTLWFGVVFMMAVIIGMITPPFGYILFYFKGLGHDDTSMMDIYRSALPYIPLAVLVLVLCIFFPQIILWLPNRMIQ